MKLSLLEFFKAPACSPALCSILLPIHIQEVQQLDLLRCFQCPLVKTDPPCNAAAHCSSVSKSSTPLSERNLLPALLQPRSSLLPLQQELRDPQRPTVAEWHQQNLTNFSSCLPSEAEQRLSGVVVRSASCRQRSRSLAADVAVTRPSGRQPPSASAGKTTESSSSTLLPSNETFPKAFFPP